MNIEEMLERVDIDIADAKKQVNLQHSLNRLHENKDFQALIMEGYLKDEAHRICLCMADPEFDSPEKQENLHRMAFGVGSLFQYFRKVAMMGQMSQSALDEHEQTRQQLLEEQGEVL